MSNGSSIGTATTDVSGNFSVVPSSELAEGSYSLTVTATDYAGNTSDSSIGISITIDITAPGQTTISTGTTTTTDTTPTISGTAEAGSTINLMSNGSVSYTHLTLPTSDLV